MVRLTVQRLALEGDSTTVVYNRHGTLHAPLPSTVPADAHGSSIVDYSYSYNPNGTIAKEVRAPGGQTTTTSSYTYDTLGRLSQATLPDGTVRDYGFDLDSNRTQIAETPACWLLQRTGASAALRSVSPSARSAAQTIPGMVP